MRVTAIGGRGIKYMREGIANSASSQSTLWIFHPTVLGQFLV